MDWSQLLQANADLLWTAIISAIVSASVSYLFKRREIRFNLSAEYEHEQRKKLRNLMGSYHGRVLQAANRLNQRFWNLYTYVGRGWLNVNGNYSNAGYYFNTTAHRFLRVCTLARRFEAEALYIDARIAEKNDFAFLNYLSAFTWCATTASLFDGLEYDVENPVDHFFGDRLRAACDSCWVNDRFVSLEIFEERLKEDRSLDSILAIFDSIRPDEARFRWDKMVAFHLLLLAFVNRFGYGSQRSTRENFLEVAKKAQRPSILKSLVRSLDKLGLGKDPEARHIVWAVTRMTEKRKVS
jgi:hypothetical protein